MKLGIFSLWTDSRAHESVYGEADEMADLTPTPVVPVALAALPKVALMTLDQTPLPPAVDAPIRASRVRGTRISKSATTPAPSRVAAAPSRVATTPRPPRGAARTNPTMAATPVTTRTEIAAKRPAPKSRRRGQIEVG